MFSRDRQPELMDDPSLPKSEHEHALRGLSRLNWWSGVAGATYRRLRGFANTEQRTLRVLDVASGSGDVPLAWARKAAKEGLNLQITTADISEVAADTQQRRAQRAGVSINSLVLDCVNSPLPSGHDVITCSLFMHHLDDRSVLKLLQAMESAAERGIMVCDLDRSRFNFLLVGLASRIVTRSSVVHTDALLSVRAAYTRAEFKSLAEQALLRPLKVDASFPCRFIMTVGDVTSAVAVPAFA